MTKRVGASVHKAQNIFVLSLVVLRVHMSARTNEAGLRTRQAVRTADTPAAQRLCPNKRPPRNKSHAGSDNAMDASLMIDLSQLFFIITGGPANAPRERP